AAHIFQAAGLEALDQDGRVLGVEAVIPNDLDESILERAAAGRAAAIGDRLGVVPGRVLGFGIDEDRTPGLLAPALGDVDQVLEADDRKLAVENFWPLVGGVIGGAGDQGLQLGHGEIGDRPVVGVVLAVHDQ